MSNAVPRRMSSHVAVACNGSGPVIPTLNGSILEAKTNQQDEDQNTQRGTKKQRLEHSRSHYKRMERELRYIGRPGMLNARKVSWSASGFKFAICLCAVRPKTTLAEAVSLDKCDE